MPQQLISNSKKRHFLPTPQCSALPAQPRLPFCSFESHLRCQSSCHPALSLPWLPTALCSRDQSCRQCLFPRQTHSRLMQQSITVFWVSFSLCFQEIRYTQPEVWILTEYQVNIFMEVLILTPKHSSKSQVSPWHCLWMRGSFLLTCVTQPSTTLDFICCFTRQPLAT